MAKIGKKGVGQGVASQKLKIDEVYEIAKKEGRLDSASIFGGANLPWTNKQLDEQFNPKVKPGAPALASKKLSPEEVERLKANLAKVSRKNEKDKAKEATPAAASPAPKKLFGLF